ncbi:hypothetical protein [Massilia sp. Mn16-1_5]|uniref:hypothetical protein n=1 Tax=Massilia sp. Mn16-1_5 TaxID=2079199 RepID=UPI00109ED83A|nr:hypothetical protein [Massilia sp. Mn16-1_5]THC45311.1 hypothetical protein C2862_05910 [Massilia sp. Mn16-1_5]
MKHKRCLGFLCLAATSQIAQAHGEEVLVSIYAQLLSVALCVLFLLFWRAARPYRLIGMAACIAGLAVADWALAPVPYTEHQTLVTTVGFVVPIITSLSAVSISRRIVDRKRSRGI